MTPADSPETRVRESAARVFTPEGVEVFMVGANKLLNGQRPVDLIEQGEADQVLAVLDVMAEGVFL